jgi:hypothetical protein
MVKNLKSAQRGIEVSEIEMNKKHVWVLLPLAYIVWWFYTLFTWAIPLLHIPLRFHQWAGGAIYLMMVFIMFGGIVLFVAGLIILRILRR